MTKVTADFVGGPWDGELRELVAAHPTIEVPVLTRAGGDPQDPDEYLPVRCGRYWLKEMPKDKPLRYWWREPKP